MTARIRLHSTCPLRSLSCNWGCGACRATLVPARFASRVRTAPAAPCDTQVKLLRPIDGKETVTIDIETGTPMLEMKRQLALETGAAQGRGCVECPLPPPNKRAAEHQVVPQPR